MQTKRRSAIEAATNTIGGYWFAIGLQHLIFPPLGIEIADPVHHIIGFAFAAQSFARSYMFRRFFEWLWSWLDRTLIIQRFQAWFKRYFNRKKTTP